MHYRKPRKGLLQYLGIKHHEYWPWWMLVAPIWPLWAWFMLRTRNLTWFTAVNPGMEDSGFLGESKIKILDSIAEQYKPKTIFIEVGQVLPDKILDFPFIAKPDIGGRGRKIKIITTQAAFEAYHQEVGEDYMIQTIIPYDVEFGVFYIRMPWQSKGEIVSLSQKEFLHVKGDGKSTLKELMQLDYRSTQQIERLETYQDLSVILPEGKTQLLEPIGNHCRGTIFRDKGDLISTTLCEVFDNISQQIEGFYYGRFDLRTKSFEDMLAGKHIYILELNGLTSDAAHIFDPNARLRDAMRVQISNCIKSYKIARYNLKQGAKTTPIKELYRKSVKGF
ncbi:MAG: hypothetical protein IPO02_13710 [Bacteroidetes bacterium]|nr:hypothetical protein [Bacteroidota bacterium]